MQRKAKKFGGRRSPSAKGRRSQKDDWEPDSRDLDIYHDHCRGIGQRIIAERWEISSQRVSKIVQNINDYLVPRYMDQIKALKAEHTARLMIIFNEAMDAWRKSKEDFVSEEQSFEGQLPSGKVTDKPKPTESKRTRRGQSGGAQYLAEARAALKEIRDIWGANAPLADSSEQSERIAGRSREEAAAEILNELQSLTLTFNQETK